MRTRTIRLLPLYALVGAGCGGQSSCGGGQLAQISPPAQKPILQEVKTSKGTETAVKLTYDLLPANAVAVRFQIPTFTELDVYQDGALLTRNGGTSGTYSGTTVTNTQTTADWRITLSSSNFANPSRVWLAIRNRSVNPDFIGRQRVSDPLILCVFDSNVTGCGTQPTLPPPVAPAGSVAFTDGVDCKCSKTGAYVVPALPKAPAYSPQTATMGNSPNNVYKVQISTAGGTTTLEVTHLTSNALVLQQSFTGTNPEYGFSPDDARFAYSYTAGGSRVTRLYDLSPATGATKRLDRSTTATQVFAGFSPNGKYFIHATATGSTAFVDVLVAATGTLIYQSVGFTFQAPAGPATSQFPPVVWGFSPDAGDRTFSYWYWTAPGSAQWTTVNLGTSKVVLTTGATGVSLARFSPCGDVLALISQASNQTEVRAYRTRDGYQLGDPQNPVQFSGSVTPALQCTTAGHTATAGGGAPKTLAPNTAGDPHC